MSSGWERPNDRVYDDIERHLPEAGSIDRAVVPLGMYVAFLAQHQLLGERLCEEAATLITRVRFREITGSELLLAGCGGRLEDDHLSGEGRALTERYYPRYLEDFRGVFGDAVYDVEDDWAHYDRLAPRLAKALMDLRGNRGRRAGRRRWWQLWLGRGP